MVGRSLRACIDLAAIGENTIAIDCDVLQADGGTRTAAITGAYVALVDAVTYLRAAGRLADPQPISCAIAAVSVGVVDGRVRLDLPYEEDSRAEVDMNVVATDTGTLVEIQGPARGRRSRLDARQAARLRARRLRTAVRDPAGRTRRAVPGRAARGDRAQERRRSAVEREDPGRQPECQKLGELRRVLAAAGIEGLEVIGSTRYRSFPRPPGDRRDVRGERDRQGRGRRGGHRAAVRRRRFRLEVDALNGMPACCRRGGAVVTATTTPTPRCCSDSWRTCPTSDAVRRSCRRAHSPSPDRTPSSCGANGVGGSCESLA